MTFEKILYCGIFLILQKKENIVDIRAPSPEWLVVENEKKDQDYILQKSIFHVLNNYNINKLPVIFE